MADWSKVSTADRIRIEDWPKRTPDTFADIERAIEAEAAEAAGKEPPRRLRVGKRQASKPTSK
jgi:hypothetical protein